MENGSETMALWSLYKSRQLSRPANGLEIPTLAELLAEYSAFSKPLLRGDLYIDLGTRTAEAADMKDSHFSQSSWQKLVIERC